MNNNEVEQKMTIREFAKTIGYSVGTVSSVLNNRHEELGISSGTVEYVRTQARLLGYRPNISAKKLRANAGKKCSFDIAVITSYESPAQFLSTFMEVVENVTSCNKYKAYNFTTQVLMYHVGEISELPGILDESRFNGAIITNTIAEDERFFIENQINYPVVFIGRNIPNYSCVTVDSVKSGNIAADILIDKCGSKNPVVLLPQILTQATQGRMDGFGKHCELKNIKPVFITANGFNEESGYNAIIDYINKGGKIDGLYSVFETLAIGAYYAIKKRGLRIPEDVAIIETGEVAIGNFLDPPMSSFRKSELELTETAIEMLLEQLIGRTDNMTCKILTPEPILRQSTDRK